MIETDIAALDSAVDGKITKVHTDCQQCENFMTFDGENPVLDALIYVYRHEKRTGHDDFDLGVTVMKYVETVDMEIRVGDTIESAQ